jgi:hypothetical protein
LIGGWVAGSERLRVRVARAGATGAFTVRVTVANVGVRNDQWHRVETQFVCDKSSLSEFARGLDDGTEVRRTTLSGDSESIA